MVHCGSHWVSCDTTERASTNLYPVGFQGPGIYVFEKTRLLVGVNAELVCNSIAGDLTWLFNHDDGARGRCGIPGQPTKAVGLMSTGPDGRVISLKDVHPRKAASPM